MSTESQIAAQVPDWRRGFEPTTTALDCLACGARIGLRPELAERHRRWHRELEDRLNWSNERERDLLD